MPRTTSQIPRTLALDVALTNTGAAFFDENMELKDTAIIKTKKSQDKKILKSIDQMNRIFEICDDLDHLVELHTPQIIVAELPTGGGHSSSAVEGMSIGKTIVCCYSNLRQIPLIPLTPTQVKKVTGDRTASKEKMQIWAARRYPVLRQAYRSDRSKHGFTGDFEHVADAIGAYHAAVDLGLLVK